MSDGPIASVIEKELGEEEEEDDELFSEVAALLLLFDEVVAFASLVEFSEVNLDAVAAEEAAAVAALKGRGSVVALTIVLAVPITAF